MKPITLSRETPDERLDRLRRSVRWVQLHGTVMDEVIWQRHLAHAEWANRPTRLCYYILLIACDYYVGPFPTEPAAKSFITFLARRGEETFGYRVKEWTMEQMITIAAENGQVIVTIEEELAHNPESTKPAQYEEQVCEQCDCYLDQGTRYCPNCEEVQD